MWASYLKRVYIRVIKGHLSNCPLPLGLGHVRIPDLVHVVYATRVSMVSDHLLTCSKGFCWMLI